MRKNAGSIMVALLLLVVPALANAWTLTVKVAGGTATDNVKVVYGATTKILKGGTSYLYPTGSATITFEGAAPATSTLDGAANAGPITLSSGSHIVAATYAASVSSTGFSITQADGGVIYAKNMNGTWTTTGISGVPAGTVRPVTIAADGNHKIVDYSLDGGAAITAGVTGAAGQVLPLSATAAGQTITATFAVAGKVTANLYAPTNGVTGSAVNTSVTATSNDTGLLYAFDVTGPASFSQPASAAATFSFLPTAVGTYTITATVTSANGGLATAAASVVIADAAAATASVCTSCHTSSTPAVVAAFNSTGHMNSNLLAAEVKSCQTCHTDTPHDKGASCVGCHSFAQNAGAPFVQDNNGVRAITGEFEKRSHHVTGRDVKDSDCAVCHLEGKKDGIKVVVDTAYHMTDDKIYLRNGNIALVGNQTKSVNGAYPWQPSNPDHTLMDQFCFSCHNAAGAPDAAAALAGVAGYTGTALNPFGDSVSNSYDQVSRVNVVGVYEQFDTNNSSHHAVRGQKYTSKNLTAAQFTNISTANMAYSDGVTAAPIKGVKSITGTMFELGKFNATYTTLNGVALADDNVLHCGDCHTVGQFRAADVNTAAGSFNKAVIGAHGSNNEYMLRNSNGDDVLNKDALVCYICHTESLYQAHNGANANATYCNGNQYNTAGLAGLARLNVGAYSSVAGRTVETFLTQVEEGKASAAGGGNIFGNKCLACHNASDKKTFGGIHGNAGNASYTTYSGAKVSTGAVTTVSRKPYRFMPGLGNFRYNGGDSAEQWTVKAISQANKQGCYTLNGTSLSKSPTKAANAGVNVNTATGTGIADDNGILGSWGACTDHAGTSVFGGRATTRTILRPLTY